MRRSWLALLVVVAILPIAPSRPSLADSSLTPAEIFKKHAAAVGYSLVDGSAKPFVMTFETLWSDEESKPHHSITVRHQAGAYYREDTTFLGVTGADGFNDGGFWTSTPSGSVAPSIGLLRAFHVTTSVIDAEAFDDSLKPEARPPNGADLVVRIHPPDGREADVYFNQSTWLIDRAIVDPEGFSLREEFSDYQRRGPVMVAMTRKLAEFNAIGQLQYESRHVTDFQWNSDFPADELNAPPIKPHIVFSTSGSTSIPFDDHPNIQVEASINGFTGRFVLDPSTFGVIITPHTAERAGMIPEWTRQAYVGEFMVYKPVRSIKIGDVEMKDVGVGVADGYYLYDTIGYDLFAQSVVTFDFGHRMLTITAPNKFNRPTQGANPLINSGGFPQVLAQANGKVPMVLQLVPGALSELVLWKGIFADKDRANALAVTGGHIDTLKVGSIIARNVAVETADPIASITGSMGLLGYRFLSRYSVTFDYPDALIYFNAPTQ